MLHLIYGGSGSGKSEYAESLVIKETQGKRYYVATMQVFDEESRRRVARHKAMRADKKFDTIECEREIAHVCDMGVTGKDTILLECLSNLVANEMFSGEHSVLPDGKKLIDEIFQGILRLGQTCKNFYIVSNDIFSDGEQYDESVETYITVLGTLHQKIASVADHVTEVVYGIPIVIK